MQNKARHTGIGPPPAALPSSTYIHWSSMPNLGHVCPLYKVRVRQFDDCRRQENAVLHTIQLMSVILRSGWRYSNTSHAPTFKMSVVLRPGWRYSSTSHSSLLQPLAVASTTQPSGTVPLQSKAPTTYQVSSSSSLASRRAWAILSCVLHARPGQGRAGQGMGQAGGHTAPITG